MCFETDARYFDTRRFSHRSAFTLIELTAVLALMAILAGITTVSVRHYMVKGKQNAARSEIATIANALEEFRNLYDRYPTYEEGLAVLVQKTEKSPEGLLTRKPVDPWGHPYQYNRPGRSGTPYEIVCFGADGREGGEGGDADIYSTNPREGSSKDKSRTAGK